MFRRVRTAVPQYLQLDVFDVSQYPPPQLHPLTERASSITSGQEELEAEQMSQLHVDECSALALNYGLSLVRTPAQVSRSSDKCG